MLGNILLMGPALVFLALTIGHPYALCNTNNEHPNGMEELYIYICYVPSHLYKKNWTVCPKKVNRYSLMFKIM